MKTGTTIESKIIVMIQWLSRETIYPSAIFRLRYGLPSLLLLENSVEMVSARSIGTSVEVLRSRRKSYECIGILLSFIPGQRRPEEEEAHCRCEGSRESSAITGRYRDGCSI